MPVPTESFADSDQRLDSAATSAKTVRPAAATSVGRLGSTNGHHPTAISPSTMPAGMVVPAAIRLAAPGAMPPAAKRMPQTARTTPGMPSSTAAVELKRGSGCTSPIVSGFLAAVAGWGPDRVAGLVAEGVSNDQQQPRTSELIFAHAIERLRHGALQMEALDQCTGRRFTGRIGGFVHHVGLHVAVVGGVADRCDGVLLHHQLARSLGGDTIGTETIPDKHRRFCDGWCRYDDLDGGFGRTTLRTRQRPDQCRAAPQGTDGEQGDAGEDTPDSKALKKAPSSDGNPRASIKKEVMIDCSH